MACVGIPSCSSDCECAQIRDAGNAILRLNLPGFLLPVVADSSCRRTVWQQLGPRRGPDPEAAREQLRLRSCLQRSFRILSQVFTDNIVT